MLRLTIVVLSINKLIIRFLTKAMYKETKNKYVKNNIIFAKPNYKVKTFNKSS